MNPKTLGNFIGTFILIIVGLIVLIRREQKLDSQEPKIQVISNKYNDPIFTWDSENRKLVITQHMTRDTLICMRDDCRLVEGWVK